MKMKWTKTDTGYVSGDWWVEYVKLLRRWFVYRKDIKDCEYTGSLKNLQYEISVGNLEAALSGSF